VGGYDTSGYAYGVAVSGNYAYVADGDRWTGSNFVGSLQVIDVRNPANPVRMGGYNTNGLARGVAVSGNYAYVADYNYGLWVIDVSKPANPMCVGGYETSGWASGVAVSGNYAYVADGGAGLRVVDVSNPTNPVHVGRYDTSGSALGVAVVGNYAYVADGEWGLAILQLSGGKNLRVGVLGWSNNTVRVSVPTTSGKSYGLEYKDSLSEPEWTRLPAASGTGGQLILTYPAAPGPQRFYRVREE
jgi:hypothetical protein